MTRKHKKINDEEYVIASAYNDKCPACKNCVLEISNKGRMYNYNAITQNHHRVFERDFNDGSMMSFLKSVQIGTYFSTILSFDGTIKAGSENDNNFAKKHRAYFLFFGEKQNEVIPIENSDLSSVEYCSTSECNNTSLIWRMGSLLCPCCKKYYAGL